MAFAATHIRFAADVHDVCGITDMRRYIAGTLYPDSRYMTHIDRHLTHPERWEDPTFYTDPFFWADDFRKGWFVHLLCDNMQYLAMREFFPQAFETSGTEQWVRRSALKFLQDIDDMKKTDIGRYLPCLEYAEAPNGESIEGIQAYNRLFVTAYADSAHFGIENERIVAKGFGLDDALIERLIQQCEAYHNDLAIVETVQNMYPEMIRRGKEMLALRCPLE